MGTKIYPPTGITNGASANAIPKSDGTNLVASSITDDGTTAVVGSILRVPVGAYPATAGLQLGTGTKVMSRGSDGEFTIVNSGGSSGAQFDMTSGWKLSQGLPFSWASTTNPNESGADTGLARNAAGIVKVTNGSTGGGSMLLQEVSAPSAPADGHVVLYAEDGGGGKTKLMARFPTGSAVQVAIEP